MFLSVKVGEIVHSGAPAVGIPNKCQPHGKVGWSLTNKDPRKRISTPPASIQVLSFHTLVTFCLAPPALLSMTKMATMAPMCACAMGVQKNDGACKLHSSTIFLGQVEELPKCDQDSFMLTVKVEFV